MTSTAAGLAFYNHVIPLVSKFVKTSETHVTLSRTVSSGQDITEKRKFSVLLLNNHDVETICRCILEFRDVCHTTRLSLTQGPLKFTYFRQCLDGITRDDWDLITANSNPTNDGFHQATTELLLQNIKPTDLADQEHYIRHCKKPFKYNCHELSSRLQFMNKMMSLFPGAHDTPPFTHQDLKNIYFKMMPIEWQHAFINNGQDIASNHYTLLNLQQYMGTQETLRRALTQARRSQNNQSRIQSQNENTPNQRRRIEENNNGPYRQRFRPQNSHNGNTRNFQHHPYYRNTTNNNNQATSNNRGQQPECNRRAGQTHLPPLFHHRNVRLCNVQTICTTPTTTTITHMKMKMSSIKIIMNPTTPSITRIMKTPTNNPSLINQTSPTTSKPIITRNTTTMITFPLPTPDTRPNNRKSFQ